MNAPVKFLFEDDFAAGHPGPGKRTVTAAAHEAALARVEAEAYRKGVAAAEAEIEGRAAAACDRIAQAIGTMARELSAIEARLEAESVEVAVAVAGAPDTSFETSSPGLPMMATGCASTRSSSGVKSRPMTGRWRISVKVLEV